MPICIYPPSAEDFTTNGLGILTPLECTIEEVAAGKYELEIVIPIDDTLRWMQLQAGCIIKAPAPVRETPLYEAPALGEPVTVTRQVWEVTGTSHGLYIRSGPGMSYSRIGIKRNGDQVIELEDHPDPWKKVCVVDGGQVGYMSTKYLKPVRTITEVIEPGKPTGGSAVKIGQSRDQLFRVFSVEQDSNAGTVTAQALHVFYDESGNLIDAEYEIEEGKTEEVNSVIVNINSKLLTPSTVRFQPINLTGDITGVFSYKTPVEAYLDPDEGIVKQTKALLVRDNYEAYLLPNMVRDRGVTIRRGKNLIGVEVTNDISKVVTRIIPVGKNKNGDPLYLTDAKYVDSPRIGDYPIPRVQRIEYDVQTGKDNFKNDAAVRTEIKRLAEEEYSKNGVDLPTYGMEVDFVLLGNTAEYADFASLQAVHLYDTVTVIDEMLALTAKVRVTGYKWNCLTGQYESVTLGELQDVKQTVYSYNLPTGGIAGNKIMNNSLGGTALRNATIEYAKITNAAIQQLSANAITALTARIKEIVSEKLTTDELYAAYAEMIALKVGTITADNIETDALAAELARITVLAAGTATFDQATIQHLVARAMNLEFGTAGQVFIRNLAVEYAQMVGAAIGELCIKASDGNYYLMDVNPDGTVTATRTDVSGGEIAAGQTSGGKVILDTNITAANLNAGNLLATYALINQIDAARINVDQLFAREAFVTLLRTTKIVGDTTITMMVNQLKATQIEAGETARVFRQETFPGSAEKVKPRDLLVIPSTGQVYQAVDMSYLNLRFYLEDNGDLTYTIEDSTEHYTLEVRGYDLYAENFVVSIRDDGTIGQPYVWELVRDLELQSEINAQAEAMAQAVAGLNKDIESLQDQLDGNITTWFEDYVPTATNLPASEWVTEADKNMHIGDLFYVDNEALEEDGYCYRWQLVDGVYGWVLVRDSAVTKALEEAKEAKDLADSKRRIFVATPVPPYDVGDMWVQGSGGDILRCNAAKAKGQAYAASDWILASKYTDDTKANQAIDMVNGTVASVDVEYALSASPTTPPEASAWSTVAPEWVNGKFMWSRTTTTLINGQVYSSNITCIAGAVGPQGEPGADGTDGIDGTNGVDGVGIVSVSEQYYLSPSKVQPTGGAWLDYVPVWVAGMYMWTRTKVAYTNGNITYTEPYCDTAWELAEDLSVYEGTLPPSTAKEGKLWLDRSVVPSVLRRWMGTVTDTSDMNGWETVNDTATIEAAQDALQAKQAALEAEQKNLNTFLRIDTEMVRIGKVGVTSEFQIDPWGAGVAINDKVFSRFESDRVRFGDMEIRRPAVGGLVFDSVEDLAEVNMIGY